jgi:hypothetical protein
MVMRIAVTVTTAKDPINNRKNNMNSSSRVVSKSLNIILKPIYRTTPIEDPTRKHPFVASARLSV